MKRATGTGWSTIAPLDNSALVLPPQAGRAPSGAITIEHFRLRDPGRVVFSEGAHESCRLTIALQRGQVRVQRNGSTLHAGPVLPGMMRFSEPGDEVTGEILSGVEAVVVSLPPALLTELLPGSRGLDSIKPILQQDAQTESLGRTLLGVRHLDAQYRGLFGGGVVDALLAILFDRGGRADWERNTSSAFSPEQVATILDFADERIGAPLDIAGWAARFGLPAQEFARRFRAATGLAPYSYFMRRRIERAQELLARTASPLAEIALDVGFSSQSHFTDAFRRVTGTAPGRWRRARAV